MGYPLGRLQPLEDLGWNTAVFRDEGLLIINRLTLHIEAKGYSEAKAIIWEAGFRALFVTNWQDCLCVILADIENAFFNGYKNIRFPNLSFKKGRREYLLSNWLQ